MGGLAGALRPLFPEWAGDLPPSPEPAEDATAARHRVFRALAELLERLNVDLGGRPGRTAPRRRRRRRGIATDRRPARTRRGQGVLDPGHRGAAGPGRGSEHSGAQHYQDTYLQTPALDLSADANPGLQFATDLQPAVNSTATVELSIDNGKHWTTVWTAHGFPGHAGPGSVAVALPDAAHTKGVQVRLHYTGSWSKWWAIDDVFLGNRTCTPTAGGLVVGQVSDPAGTGIPGAQVASTAHPTPAATTVATPDDPTLGDGLYWLFSPGTGAQRFTATADGYHPATATVTVTANLANPLDLTLTAPGG